MQQTVDADAKITAEVSSEITIPVCGSSCYSSSVADADAEEWTTDVVTGATTAACGSSFCSSSVADVATTADASITSFSGGRAVLML